MSCFCHLEKPIKTKEHKRKHFVFICFYWSYPVFLDGESNIFQTQRRRDTEVFFLRTRNARKKRRPSFILYFPCSDKIFAPLTKEYKRKHFVFICFYWFYPVFLDGESNIFQTQRRRDTEVFFLRTRNARKKRRPSFILYFPCSDKIFAPLLKATCCQNLLNIIYFQFTFQKRRFTFQKIRFTFR